MDSNCTEIRIPKNPALLRAMCLNCGLISYAIFAVKYSSLGRSVWSGDEHLSREWEGGVGVDNY